MLMYALSLPLPLSLLLALALRDVFVLSCLQGRQKCRSKLTIVAHLVSD